MERQADHPESAALTTTPNARPFSASMGAIRRSPSASELTQLDGIMQLIRDGHPNRRSFEAAASRLRLR
jgi:hypothetical protein